MKFKNIFLSLILATSSVTCLPTAHHCKSSIKNKAQQYSEQLAKPNKLILVTIDGVRWFDVIEHSSELPNVKKYFEKQGVIVGRETSMQLGNPHHVSLPGYYEILSGKVTACTNNDCPQNTDKTIVNYVDSSIVFASWNKIRNVVYSETTTVNTKNSYRPDAETINEAKKTFSQLPTFTWISLGDTDEWAHAKNYEQYHNALKSADAFIGELAEKFGTTSSIVVTTDHGRNNNFKDHDRSPEAGYVFALFYGKNVPALGHVKLNRTVHSYELQAIMFSLLGATSSRDFILQ